MTPTSAGRARLDTLDEPSTPASVRRTRRPKRLSTGVSEELVRRIISGEYPVGTLLPPEPHFVAEFDVSRPVVREAMKFLEAAGLVTIRQGEGTLVRESSKWNFIEPSVLRIALALNLASRMRRDAIKLRLDLDLTLLDEAAPKLDAKDFAEMQRHLETMDRSTDFLELQEADLGFHQVYQSRAGNQLTEGIVHLLVEEMPPPDRVTTDPRTAYDAANLQHWAIFNALRDGRFADAQQALREHISQMWTWRSEAAPS